ncbi:MAG: glycoside hydrolase family 97 catalytic domain-containing protein [Paludibacter sp.]|nr:glycoside hydrolase family 97 catalytic domain-containing protein [Paludibacter sp.]
MNRSLQILLFLIWLLPVSFCAFGQTSVSSVSSPDGKIRVELVLRNDSLFYKTYRNNLPVIDLSNTGIQYTAGSFLKNMTLDKQSTREINETYSLPSGKTSTYLNHCNELTLTFKNLSSVMEIVFRVYNDGYAFRYGSPLLTNLDIAIQQENSFINVYGFGNSWVQKYHPDYSWYYEKRDWSSNFSQKELNTPALVKSGDTYLLISEAANYGNYAASKLIAGASTGSYYFQPVGSIITRLPFVTPWRVVIMGDLKDVVESVMIENLNPSTEIGDLSWIKQGRVSWDWGGEDAQNTVGFDTAKQYIDMASYMGWEYFNLDDGWDSSRAGYTLQDIVNYAAGKSVGLIVWTHHNRFQNNRQDIYNKLKVWKDMGVKGIKVDFWEDDAQAMIQKYDKLIEVAAELQLLVNLHGCTKPSGIRRRWPNLLTSEAVLGGEFYIGNDSHMVHARHNISLVMTRNVIGPMDYTPCDFGKKDGRILQVTSWSHQLALTVAYESGLQYLVDQPRNYRHHIAESFLRHLPVAWNETKCIEAEPDRFVTIARRSGSDWYVASLSDENRDLNLNLSFLIPGVQYNAYIYKDGDCMSEISFDYKAGLTTQELLTIPVKKSGGVTIHFSERTDYPKPAVQKYEAEVNFTFGTKPTDPDKLCSGEKYVAGLGKNNTLKFNNITVPQDGEYALTVYYMSPEERTAYIRLNNATELLYYPFVNTGGETGRYLAFKTFIVMLKQGSNIIEFGNKQAFCPNIDRITIKALNDHEGETSYRPLSLKENIRWKVRGNEVLLNSVFNGNYTVYNIRGSKVTNGKFTFGENAIQLSDKGFYIINLSSGTESYSFKVKL